MNDGKAIRKLRRDMEISQREVAAHCGIPQTFISLIEHEERMQDYRARVLAFLKARQAQQEQAA